MFDHVSAFGPQMQRKSQSQIAVCCAAHRGAPLKVRAKIVIIPAVVQEERTVLHALRNLKFHCKGRVEALATLGMSGDAARAQRRHAHEDVCVWCARSLCAHARECDAAACMCGHILVSVSPLACLRFPGLICRLLWGVSCSSAGAPASRARVSLLVYECGVGYHQAAPPSIGSYLSVGATCARPALPRFALQVVNATPRLQAIKSIAGRDQLDMMEAVRRDLIEAMQSV